MNLEDVRKGIDHVDNQMRELFKERMALANNVAVAKAETEDAIYKPEREDVIYSRARETMVSHLEKEYIAFVKRTMEISRKYQYGKTLELRGCFPFALTREEGETDALYVSPQHTHLKFSFQCGDKNGNIATPLTMIADYDVKICDLQVETIEAGVCYQVVVDIEANLLQAEIQAMIFQLSEENNGFSLLASY